MVIDRARLVSWLGWPTLALLCYPAAALCPTDTVAGQGALSILLSAPPWILLFWAVMGLLPLGPGRTRRLHPALAAIGIVAACPPGWPRAEPAGPRIVSANVNAFSPDTDPTEVEATLAAQGADLVVTLEKRALSIPGMVRVADNFDDDLVSPSHGTAIFCREGLPCRAEIVGEFGSPLMHMPLGLVSLPGRLCVLALHAPPPVPYDATGLTPYMTEITSRVEAGRLRVAWGPCQAGDVVVATGDFNAVPGSPDRERLVEVGLHDPDPHQGIRGGTWPSGGGWMWLPVLRLDQVLVGPVEVGPVRKIDLPGSDHKGLVYRVGTGG